MLAYLQKELWSPYVVGIGIGVLSWLSFLLSAKQLGCSSAVSHTSGMIEMLWGGARVRQKEYYKKYPPVVDWRWMLVIGIFIGSALSAVLSGTLDINWVPLMWKHVFGPAVLPRLVVAFIGGVLMGFGARWADGCTSGHGISGTLQLAVSSWISVVFFFIGGITCAMLIYQVLGK